MAHGNVDEKWRKPCRPKGDPRSRGMASVRLSVQHACAELAVLVQGLAWLRRGMLLGRSEATAVSVQ
jgi:hypothetical protein